MLSSIEWSLVAGQWTGQLRIQAGEEEMQGWEVLLVFSSPLDYIDCITGSVSGSGALWTITSKDWDSSIPAGGHLDLLFQASGHNV